MQREVYRTKKFSGPVTLVRDDVLQDNKSLEELKLGADDVISLVVEPAQDIELKIKHAYDEFDLGTFRSSQDVRAVKEAIVTRKLLAFTLSDFDIGRFTTGGFSAFEDEAMPLFFYDVTSTSNQNLHRRFMFLTIRIVGCHKEYVKKVIRSTPVCDLATWIQTNLCSGGTEGIGMYTDNGYKLDANDSIPFGECERKITHHLTVVEEKVFEASVPVFHKGSFRENVGICASDTHEDVQWRVLFQLGVPFARQTVCPPSELHHAESDMYVVEVQDEETVE